MYNISILFSLCLSFPLLPSPSLSLPPSLFTGGATDVPSIGKTVDNISNITDIGTHIYLFQKTLNLLPLSSHILEANSGYTITTSSVILTVLIVLIPIWLYLSYKNSATKNVLFYGWFPVICAMVISR